MPIPNDIKKISDTVWEVPMTHKPGMLVPARIIATEKILEAMDAEVIEQITNVATLPGIQKYALCMPDGHFGYGFPIGGVAAFDLDTGVISPGGVGFDINCGMRLARTNLKYSDIKDKIKTLVDELFKAVPCGVGCSGFVKITKEQFKEVCEKGAEWAVEKGYGWKEDLERTEENGRIKEADVSAVSDKAIKRGFDQIGTLGSGNHYLEIQRVGKIHDAKIAKQLGLFEDQIVVMFHCGSRGFGHQVATDYMKNFLDVMETKYHIKLLDRELACAPFKSPEGQAYYKAMNCAINMSFANRQVILHRVREVFSQVLGKTPEEMEMHQIYDVCHNTAKVETYNGKKVLVHRKGATRSWGPGYDESIALYEKIGQPVIIGGSMETGSYLLLGTKTAENETFGSTAHGSGRTMSRNEAQRRWDGKALQKDMEARGIYVKTASYAGLAEEAGAAYKEIDDVIDSTDKAGISKPIAKFLPCGNVKG